MRPALVLIPRIDEAFARLALGLIDAGVETPEDLQTALREQFPDTIVRARELEGESRQVLYATYFSRRPPKRNSPGRPPERRDGPNRPLGHPGYGRARHPGRWTICTSDRERTFRRANHGR